DLVAFGGTRAGRHQIVVVQIHAVRAELGELAHDRRRRQRRPDRLTEWIASGIADGPEPEGEVVLRPWLIAVLAVWFHPGDTRLAPASCQTGRDLVWEQRWHAMRREWDARFLPPERASLAG